MSRTAHVLRFDRNLKSSGGIFSSLNSINSKWRRLVDPVVACQQGKFDMLLKHREKAVKGFIWKEKYFVLFLTNFLSIYGPPVSPVKLHDSPVRAYIVSCFLVYISTDF